MMIPEKNSRRLIYRSAALVCVLSLALDSKDVFPWGFPSVAPLEGRGEYSPVDYKEDSLMFKHGRTKIIYGGNSDLVKGPETPILNPVDGTIYLLTVEGFLLSMTDVEEDTDSKNSAIMKAQVNLIRDVGRGRPLGGAFTKDGKTLYIADAVIGLTRILDIYDSRSKLEVVASSIIIDNSGTTSCSSDITKLTYVNDVCVGPETGKVYFTSASRIVPEVIGQGMPDTMYSSKTDLIRGIPTGEILEYDPETDRTRVLAQGLHFANGIAVDKEEQYLIVAETFGLRLWKYHLKGDKAGEMEVVFHAKNMMGYPDGVDCSHTTGKCYAALPSPIIPPHKLLMAVPQPVELILRYLLLMLPRKWAPPIIEFGGVLEFDPEDSTSFRYILDPKAQDIGMITGVTVHNDKLYLGSLHNQYIGLYDLA